jgi:predicted DNA-binding transcriptional regulator AlpA
MPDATAGRLSEASQRARDEPTPLVVPLAAVAERLGIEPLLSLEDLCRILGCSRRKVETMKSSGRLPVPDLHIGRLPRWKPASIRAWLDNQARGVVR